MAARTELILSNGKTLLVYEEPDEIASSLRSLVLAKLTTEHGEVYVGAAHVVTARPIDPEHPTADFFAPGSQP